MTTFDINRPPTSHAVYPVNGREDLYLQFVEGELVPVPWDCELPAHLFSRLYERRIVVDGAIYVALVLTDAEAAAMNFSGELMASRILQALHVLQLRKRPADKAETLSPSEQLLSRLPLAYRWRVDGSGRPKYILRKEGEELPLPITADMLPLDAKDLPNVYIYSGDADIYHAAVPPREGHPTPIPNSVHRRFVVDTLVIGPMKGILPHLTV